MGKYPSVYNIGTCLFREQSDLLNQINAIFDQLSSNNNQTDPSSTLEQPGNSQRARQPPTHVTCTEPQMFVRKVYSGLNWKFSSQEEAQQTIEELMTPAIVRHHRLSRYIPLL